MPTGPWKFYKKQRRSTKENDRHVSFEFKRTCCDTHKGSIRHMCRRDSLEGGGAVTNKEPIGPVYHRCYCNECCARYEINSEHVFHNWNVSSRKVHRRPPCELWVVGIDVQHSHSCQGEEWALLTDAILLLPVFFQHSIMPHLLIVCDYASLQGQ